MDPAPPQTTEADRDSEAGGTPDAPPSDTGATAAGTRWFLWPNLLSLDAPLVAVAWLWLMAKTLSVFLPEPWWHYGILAAAVWVVYVADRLLDGLSTRDDSTLTPRHRFYKNHPIPFLILIPGAAAFAISGVLHHVPSALLFAGIAVAFVAVFYLMQCVAARLQSRTLNMITVLSAASIVGMIIYQTGSGVYPPYPLWVRNALLLTIFVLAIGLAFEPTGTIFHALPKEIFCGFTFAIGVSLPVVTLIFPSRAFAEVFLLGGLFSLNCIAIAVYEAKHDCKNDPVAATRVWPRFCAYYPVIATAFALVAALVAFRQIGTSDFFLPLAVAVGAALLVGLHAVSSKLHTSALRALADFVLLVPPAAYYLYSIS